ncbi:hypothetical protein E2C01_042192 [Portunus trituberculatus]|uniref:Uncharacterized protein n=1 Tax=Portunus trituberculatus TaxID=210409 RepID=A0A5B7FT05_PORTR|nr:hypothetical protein [Portunus trituberculatus]
MLLICLVAFSLHTAPMPGDQTHVPCIGVGLCLLAPMPGGHLLPRSGLDHMDPGESVPGSLPLIQEASVEAGQPAPVPGGNEVGQGLSAPMPVDHPISAVETYEDEWNSLGIGLARPGLFICLRGDPLAPPPGNEELGGLQPVGNPIVSVSSRLLVKMEKVCGSMADIASWTDQVLATWDGASSSIEQDVLEFLSALAKANKDILGPAEEQRCRLLMLQREAVVDSCGSRVQDNEHSAFQQRALSSVIQRLASSFWGSALVPHGSKVKRADEEGSHLPLCRILSPDPLLRGGPFGPQVLTVEDPQAGIDLARVVVCSPVPVGACLQQHWREWNGGWGRRMRRLNFQMINLSLTSPFLLLQSMLGTQRWTGFYALEEPSGNTFVGPGIVILDAPAFFVMVPEPWHVVHSHNISHWICQVIQCEHEDVSENMCLVWVKAHEVRVVAMSALFKKIQKYSCCSLGRNLEEDITHQYLDTFPLGPVVSALRVIK